MEEIKAVKMNDGIYEFADYKGTTILLGFVKDIYYPIKVEIPNNIDFIWDGAFENNDKIESVIIPENVTGIGSGSFLCCTALKEVIVSSNLCYIGNSAFSGCTSLKEIDLSGCKKLDILDYVFENCTSLEEIKFSEFIKNINSNAFNGCTSLKKIYVPKRIDFKLDDLPNNALEIIEY